MAKIMECNGRFSARRCHLMEPHRSGWGMRALPLQMNTSLANDLPVGALAKRALPLIPLPHGSTIGACKVALMKATR